MKDILFLLTPGFTEIDGTSYYCPACTMFEGLLQLYPGLASKIDVRRVAFPRPRPEIVELLGEANQSCPVLILAQSIDHAVDDIRIKTAGKCQFIDDPHEIGEYFSKTYGIPRPH